MRLGYVLWFEESSGEGQVLDSATEEVFYVHYSAIEGAFQGTRVSLIRFQPIEFRTYVNIYMEQVDFVRAIEHDLTIQSEHKLNSIMNHLFEKADPAVLRIAERFYNEELVNSIL